MGARKLRKQLRTWRFSLAESFAISGKAPGVVSGRREDSCGAQFFGSPESHGPAGGNGWRQSIELAPFVSSNQRSSRLTCRGFAPYHDFTHRQCYCIHVDSATLESFFSFATPIPQPWYALDSCHSSQFGATFVYLLRQYLIQIIRHY